MNPKPGDKLICKRNADDKYFEDLRKEISYKELSYKEWDFPQKDKEFVIESVSTLGRYIIIRIVNIPRIFSNANHTSYVIWDWFYTPQEMVAISRKIKLKNIGEKI